MSEKEGKYWCALCLETTDDFSELIPVNEFQVLCKNCYYRKDVKEEQTNDDQSGR